MKITVNCSDSKEKKTIESLLEGEQTLLLQINSFFNIKDITELNIDVLDYSEYKKEFIK